MIQFNLIRNCGSPLGIYISGSTSTAGQRRHHRREHPVPISPVLRDPAQRGPGCEDPVQYLSRAVVRVDISNMGFDGGEQHAWVELEPPGEASTTSTTGRSPGPRPIRTWPPSPIPGPRSREATGWSPRDPSATGTSAREALRRLPSAQLGYPRLAARRPGLARSAQPEPGGPALHRPGEPGLPAQARESHVQHPGFPRHRCLQDRHPAPLNPEKARSPD